MPKITASNKWRLESMLTEEEKYEALFADYLALIDENQILKEWVRQYKLDEEKRLAKVIAEYLS